MIALHYKKATVLLIFEYHKIALLESPTDPASSSVQQANLRETDLLRVSLLTKQTQKTQVVPAMHQYRGCYGIVAFP